MNVFSGFGAVVALGLHSLFRRPLSGTVIIVAVAITTAILASLLAIGEGLDGMMGSGAMSNRILVLGRNAPSELQSVISPGSMAIVRDLDGWARNEDRVALASPNVMALVDLVRRRDKSHGAVVIRGWDALGFAVHPEIRMIAGRRFHPGTNEAIIGHAAQHQFVRSSLGDLIRLDDVPFRVVGIFEAGGGPLENELIADAGSVQTAKRSRDYQSATAMITSPAALSRLRAVVAADPRLELDVMNELDYRRRNIAPLRTVMDFVAYFVASTMAIGALLGTMAVMTFRIERRAREIATLQALGFENVAILAAITAEVIGLCLVGSVIGTASAAFFFSGRTIDTSGFSFSMEVTAHVLVAAMCCATLMGLVAGVSSGIAALQRQPARVLSRD